MTDRTGLQARHDAYATAPASPVRTCVGCRRRDSWSALLRVVAVRDEPSGRARLVPDPGHRLPGRGAWLHPDITCWEQAKRRKAFARALRLQDGLQGIDGREVEVHLQAYTETRTDQPKAGQTR